MRFETIVATLLPALALAAPTPQDPDFEFPADLPEDSIVGGTNARAGEYPSLVSLRRANGGHFCGGSLLNADTIITAAHCSVPRAYGPGSVSALSIRAGSLSRTSGGTVVNVRSITVNPNYNEASQNNDIAIWKLATPIQESANIKYTRLPAAGSDPASGSAASVAGWGDPFAGANTGTPNVMKVDVPIVARTQCAAAYRTDPLFRNAPITNNMICAGYQQGGRDSCQGDSGGPLVDANGVLIGVVSFGKSCALANFPGVYARVSNYLSFINSNA